MAAVTLDRSDLLPFAPNITEEQATALITGVMARTALFAPQILDADFAHEAAAKDLLLVAILRRHKSDGGLVVTETVGPFSVTVDNSSLVDGGMFTSAEMAEWALMSAEGSSASSVPVFAFPTCSTSWPDPAWRRW